MTKSRELSDTTNKQVARNDIINGNFDIWQRGTVFNYPTPTIAYNADRWLIGVNAIAGDTTVVRGSFSVDQTDVPNKPEHYYSLNINTNVTGGSEEVDIVQQIEDGYTNSLGKTFTISCWVRTNTNRDISVLYTGINDAGTDPLFGNNTTPHIESLTANAWTKIVFTVGPIQHTPASTVNLDNKSLITIRIPTPLLGEVIDIAQVQVEEGIVPTDFEILPKEEIISLCERYYEKSYNLDATPGTLSSEGMHHIYAASPTGAVSFNITWRVKKRVNPTVSFFDPILGTPGAFYNTSLAASVGPVILASLGESGIHTGGITTGIPESSNYIHYVAEAEL